MGHWLRVLCCCCCCCCVGFCLVGHVVFVGYRAQQCDLNPDLLRVLEDGYVSKCCDVRRWVGFGDVVPGGPLVFPKVMRRTWSVVKMSDYIYNTGLSQ